MLALLTGTRIEIQGIDSIPLDRPVIFVSNHMSYLDAYLLQATLPVPCSFIAKAELSENFLVRIPLLNLGAVFVERFDRERSAENAKQISKLAAGNRNFFINVIKK